MSKFFNISALCLMVIPVVSNATNISCNSFDQQNWSLSKIDFSSASALTKNNAKESNSSHSSNSNSAKSNSSNNKSNGNGFSNGQSVSKTSNKSNNSNKASKNNNSNNGNNMNNNSYKGQKQNNQLTWRKDSCTFCDAGKFADWGFPGITHEFKSVSFDFEDFFKRIQPQDKHFDHASQFSFGHFKFEHDKLSLAVNKKYFIDHFDKKPIFFPWHPHFKKMHHKGGHYTTLPVGSSDPVADVPEPSSLAIFSAGLLVLGASLRKKKKANS
ncbi:PEP-CTERM sorting domain-containing protein [Vibrio sp.]|nr:PEP-CTERM sorting domain-containing protein [Vibrio sp.]